MITPEQYKEYIRDGAWRCWVCRREPVIESTVRIEFPMNLMLVIGRDDYLSGITLYFHTECFKNVAGDEYIPEKGIVEVPK